MAENKVTFADLKPKLKVFKTAPKTSFANMEAWKYYHEELMRCGKCHQQIKDKDEFYLIPFKLEPGERNAPCILMHKQCYNEA